FLFAAVALALGMPGTGTRWLAFLMLGLAWFYTAPPLSLNYRGLGEVTVAAVLNLAVPILGYRLPRGAAAGSAGLLGVVVPIFLAEVDRMLVMNLSDHEGDRAAGKRTLAVALGPRRARGAVAIGQLAVYGSMFALMAAGVLPAIAGAA